MQLLKKTIHQNKARLALCGLLLSLLAPLAGPVKPASAAGQLIVTPAIQSVVLNPETAEAKFEFSVRNAGNIDQQVRLTTLDFGALDESGGVAFIGQSADGKETKYGLKSWITFDRDVLTLEAGEKETAIAYIANREDLSPGGHYGAIVVTPVEEAELDDPSRVEIVPSTSVLVFLKKLGGEKYGLNLQDISVGAGFFGLPENATLRFQNTGNVHVVPRGLVTIENSLGQMIARGVINSDSGIIMPETFRKYDLPIKRLGSFLPPGRYTMKTVYRYDGEDKTQEHKTTFFYLGTPLYLLLPVLLVIAVIIMIPRLRRHYGNSKKAKNKRQANQPAQNDTKA